MTFDPATLKQLGDLSGFALFIGLAIIIGIGAIRQWWVPGWLYRQERADREIADIQARRNSELLEFLVRQAKRPKAGPHAPS